MSDYDHVMALLTLPCNSRIDYACRYLQSKGKRFLVDFGLDNAEALMWDEIEGSGWGLQ